MLLFQEFKFRIYLSIWKYSFKKIEKFQFLALSRDCDESLSNYFANLSFCIRENIGWMQDLTRAMGKGESPSRVRASAVSFARIRNQNLRVESRLLCRWKRVHALKRWHVEPPHVLSLIRQIASSAARTSL